LRRCCTSSSLASIQRPPSPLGGDRVPAPLCPARRADRHARARRSDRPAAVPAMVLGGAHSVRAEERFEVQLALLASRPTFNVCIVSVPSQVCSASMSTMPPRSASPGRERARSRTASPRPFPPDRVLLASISSTEDCVIDWQSALVPSCVEVTGSPRRPRLQPQDLPADRGDGRTFRASAGGSARGVGTRGDPTRIVGTRTGGDTLRGSRRRFRW